MTANILLIENESALLRNPQLALAREGFHVELATLGLDAIRKMLVEQPDLVILGMNAREKDWQFCRRLLTFLDRPLLLLLSSSDELDSVKGLELGADDCMIQPVLSLELVARVRALLRRSMSYVSRRERSYFVDGDLVVDLTRREVWVNEQPVALTPTEFRFLTCFATHAGEVLSHERLMMQVWGTHQASARDAIKLYVHQLRQKLEPDPSRPQRIVTRRGEGYMFRRLVPG